MEKYNSLPKKSDCNDLIDRQSRGWGQQLFSLLMLVLPHQVPRSPPQVATMEPLLLWPPVPSSSLSDAFCLTPKANSSPPQPQPPWLQVKGFPWAEVRREWEVDSPLHLGSCPVWHCPDNKMNLSSHSGDRPIGSEPCVLLKARVKSAPHFIPGEGGAREENLPCHLVVSRSKQFLAVFHRQDGAQAGT